MSKVIIISLILLLIPTYSFSTQPAGMKRVLVTGGNKGIGKAICQLLLEKHPDVCVILGSRDTQRGQQAVTDLKNMLGEEICKDRLELLQIDTGSTESVQKAAQSLGDDNTNKLYGIVNNAGIGFGYQAKQNINVNYFGPRRVNDAFGPKLVRPGGRIVNIASASGPIFVSKCSDQTFKAQLTDPLNNIAGGIQQLDQIAESKSTPSADADDDDNNPYGLSKALLNAYTVLHAKEEPDLIINSCTPGFIDTSMTAGMGASNPPIKGAEPPVFLLTDDEIATKIPTGRYYGSDCIRSPLFTYRGPGDPAYEGP